MRKASEIILLVGAIVSIVAAVVYATIGGVFAALGALPTEEVVKAIQDGTWRTDVPGTVEQQAEAIKLIFTGLGVMFLVFGVLCVPNAVFGFMARTRKTQALYVCNIVFGVLSGTEITLVGGIFGLIANGQEENRKQQALE